jgi:hypothetical protein
MSVGDKVQLRASDQYGGLSFFAGTLTAIGTGDRDGYYQVQIHFPIPEGYLEIDWYPVDEVFPI